MNLKLAAAIAAIALAVIFFVPVIRRAISAIIGLAIVVGSIAFAVGGVAVLMNDVSINDSPGISARIRRFTTVNWAATSENGSGSAECVHGWGGPLPGSPAPSKPETREEKSKGRAERHERAQPSPTGTPGAPGTEPPEEQDYPELARHAYPGIPRAQLFSLAQQTVNELGGWKIINADARASTLDCVYTTRLLRFEDDVRIVVTPNSEIDICSRSRIGEPGSNSLWAIFPGDFGANIGRIKQFYRALEPKADAIYKEQEKKANGGR